MIGGGAQDDNVTTALQIGVVIPTLNEADGIARTIEETLKLDVAEIIVADGGSTDETCEIAAASSKVVVLSVPPGRGRQINAGVAAVKTPIAIVLHADTRLPPSAISHIRKSLSQPSVTCGCFQLQFDIASPWLGTYAWLSRFDSYWTTFGDQAFFFRVEDFQAVDGAPDWPLFEDIELRRRFKRKGRFEKIPLPVTTSARRFSEHGPVRTQLINAALLTIYALGVSPHRLAKLYRR